MLKYKHCENTISVSKYEMVNIYMPIKRKICKIGTGLAIFLPKSWVELLQEKYGNIEAVAIEVDEILKIAPIIKPEAPKH